MLDIEVKWDPVSETSLILYLGEEIDVSLSPLIGELVGEIKERYPLVCEVTASYCSILVEFSSPSIDLMKMGGELIKMISSYTFSDQTCGKLIELPVYYHPDVGPDLELVARSNGLTIQEVIGIHSGQDYTVCTMGFAPGFAFLAEVDARIAMPRHERPRSKVARGSVGIAGRQTAVYPMDTPGGWQIIGSCPLSLYDQYQIPLSPFEIGDRVRFIPIERADFMERGGRV